MVCRRDLAVSRNGQIAGDPRSIHGLTVGWNPRFYKDLSPLANIPPLPKRGPTCMEAQPPVGRQPSPNPAKPDFMTLEIALTLTVIVLTLTAFVREWATPDVLALTVLVLVDENEVSRQTSAFRLGLWKALGAAGAILALAQLLIFFFGFRPLRQVAGDVARVESGQADRLTGNYPRELEPLAVEGSSLLQDVAWRYEGVEDVSFTGTGLTALALEEDARLLSRRQFEDAMVVMDVPACEEPTLIRMRYQAGSARSGNACG